MGRVEHLPARSDKEQVQGRSSNLDAHRLLPGNNCLCSLLVHRCVSHLSRGAAFHFCVASRYSAVFQYSAASFLPPTFLTVPTQGKEQSRIRLFMKRTNIV